MVRITNVSRGRSKPKKSNSPIFVGAGLLLLFVVSTVLFLNRWASSDEEVKIVPGLASSPEMGDGDSNRNLRNQNADKPMSQVNPLIETKKISANSAESGKSETSTTIAYAVSVTGCGADPITEGGAVLKHAVHLTSSRVNAGKYDYQMYAIVHPEGQKCGNELEALGYKILTRETPVAVKDIKGDFLRQKIEKNGCCGEKELIKLEAYTLINHPVVVHMDLDTLILKPLDPIFDQMIRGPTSMETTVEVMWQDLPLPQKIDSFFTRDYNMAHGSMKHKPVQGGFLVLRPSMATYHEFVDIIKEGDFRQNGGWGGKVGPFYGSMTFQGLIPYFYDVLHPGTGVELNRCAWNQMCDNPRDKRTVNDIVSGNCRTGQEECEDCRSRKLEDVYTAHFTLCQKPWWCLPQDGDRIQERLCRKLHHQWYRIRSDLEKTWGRTGTEEGTFQIDQFYGYCDSHGKHGYRPIEKPYGTIASTV